MGRKSTWPDQDMIPGPFAFCRAAEPNFPLLNLICPQICLEPCRNWWASLFAAQAQTHTHQQMSQESKWYMARHGRKPKNSSVPYKHSANCLPSHSRPVTQALQRCKGANEPVHEIIVLHKLILQTSMRSHPMGLDVWFLVRPFVYFHNSCEWTAKALVANMISTIISWAGSNYFTVQDRDVTKSFEPCHEIRYFSPSVNSFFDRACAAIRWG